MAVKEKVDALIACAASKWGECDRKFLEGLNEEQLDKMSPAEEPEPEEPAEAAAPESEPVSEPASEPAMEANSQPRTKTLGEFLADAPPEVQAIVNRSLAEDRARKDDIIAKLAANTNCTFTKDQLAAKDTDELRALARLAQVEVTHCRPGPVHNERKSQFPFMPAINWGGTDATH